MRGCSCGLARDLLFGCGLMDAGEGGMMRGDCSTHNPFEGTMKKTFELTHPKIKYARLVEAAKHDVRKYLKRERRRELPDEVDFWDFDCKFGDTEADAKGIHLSEINKCIDAAEAKNSTSFYVEILAKPGHRSKKTDGDAAPEALKKIELHGFGES